MMPIKVDAGLVTPLQQAVNGACGGGVKFLSVQPVVRSNSVKVWLAMTRPAIERVMTTVMRTLATSGADEVAGSNLSRLSNSGNIEPVSAPHITTPIRASATVKATSSQCGP